MKQSVSSKRIQQFCWICFVFFMCSMGAVKSQNFEWGSNAGTPTIPAKYNVGYSVATDKVGNSYFIGNYEDSIYFGKIKIKNTFTGSGIFIVKCNPVGNIQWVKNFKGDGGISAFAISTDTLGYLYITGNYTHTIYLTTNDSLSDSGGVFLAKFDTSGKFIWVVNEGKGTLCHNIGLDKNGNIYLAGKKQGAFIGKYDKYGKNLWIKYGKTANLQDLSIDLNGNTYSTGWFKDSMQFGKLTIHGRKSEPDIFILKLDSSGVEQWLRGEGGNLEDWGMGIKCLPNGSFYNVGYFTDSARFDGIKIGGLVKGKKHASWMFISFYNANGKLKWVRKAGADSGTTQAFCIAVHNQYAYLGGSYSRCYPLFGRTGLQYYGKYSQSMAIAKMDSNGTFLWAFGVGKDSTTSITWNIATDNKGNSFSTGQLSGDVNFGNFKLTHIGAQDAFFLKISDVSLWRDNLNKTQYCEGDSITVPYRIKGVIGPTNTFTAELSDSNGSFDSVYYVIGKIKTQNSGYIKCKLPKGLPYSTRYNVHVFSDTPNVTSYYNPQTISIYPYPKLKVQYDSFLCYGQKDTLKASLPPLWGGPGWGFLWLPNKGLSNNKIANPVFAADATRTYTCIAYNPAGCTDSFRFTIKVGQKLVIKTNADTTVCPAKNLLLFAKGTGGNDTTYTYKWSTGETTKTIKVSPAKTTTYTVTVTDGCAVATKNIIVRVYSQVKVIAGKDQGICPGNPNHLFAFGKGGDSLHYSFVWDSAGVVIGKTNKIVVQPATTTIYKVKLTDNCSIKDDTAFVKVYKTLPAQIIEPKDTILCYGQSLTAKAKGGDSLRYMYRWDTAGVVVGNNATQTFTKTANYRLILTDSCSLHADTAFVKISVNPELVLSITKDTIVCNGQSIVLSATAKGGNGDTSKYVYIWDNGLGNGKTKSVLPKITTTYRCIVNDGCSLADTAFVTLKVRVKLNLQINDTAVCKGSLLTLIPKAKGGDSTNYKFRWLPKNIIANSISFMADTTQNISVILKDNCSVDSAVKNIKITVNPLPKSIIGINPTEQMLGEGSISLSALNTDADSFEWNAKRKDSTGGSGSPLLWRGVGGEAKYSFTDTGTYLIKLISKTQFGCADTAEGNVIILPQLHVYFPTAFTPNGDTLNDNWQPIGIGIKNMQLRIFNRWGEMVFKSTDKVKSWDGSSPYAPGKGQLTPYTDKQDARQSCPMGVYVYDVTFTDFAGKKHKRMGKVTLVR